MVRFDSNGKTEYDVVVCGGGIAGVSAALAAKRSGAKTLLLERSYLLGGLATAGLIAIYLPLCDGKGNQVSFGIAEELLRLSVRYGCEDKDAKVWLDGESDSALRKQKRFETQFNPNLFALLLERLLSDENVDILFGAFVTDVKKSGNSLCNLTVRTKTGNKTVSATTFVDATGDADLFYFGEAKTETFKQGNILAGWYYGLKDGKNRLIPLGNADIPEKYKTGDTADKRVRYEGLDCAEVSEFTLTSHSLILDDFISHGELSENHTLCSLPTIPQLRMTRRVVGNYTLSDEEIGKSFDDGIGLIGDWRKCGPVYQIPFRCLYGELDNVLTCGRSISVTDDMWDITRVIPACAVTGQAAGTAAALCGGRISELDVKVLQNSLVKSGVKVFFDR